MTCTWSSKQNTSGPIRPAEGTPPILEMRLPATRPAPYTKWDPFLALLAGFPDDFEVAAKISTD